MRCPFPGMDPYLERPALWSDFHDSLITYLREALQPLLRPRYVALSQDRLYPVESERPIRPDVSLVRTNVPAGRTAVLAPEPDRHLVFERTAEEIRQPVLHIVEPAAGNRVVTAIEVLSPDNKTAGPGRKSYLKKCGELRQALANLVEIDLLRGGAPLLRKWEPAADGNAAWTYSTKSRPRPTCRSTIGRGVPRWPRVVRPNEAMGCSVGAAAEASPSQSRLGAALPSRTPQTPRAAKVAYTRLARDARLWMVGWFDRAQDVGSCRIPPGSITRPACLLGRHVGPFPCDPERHTGRKRPRTGESRWARSCT